MVFISADGVGSHDNCALDQDVSNKRYVEDGRLTGLCLDVGQCYIMGTGWRGKAGFGTLGSGPAGGKANGDAENGRDKGNEESKRVVGR